MTLAPEGAEKKQAKMQAKLRALFLCVLYLFATIQIVLFYLLRVPSSLHRMHYENGLSRMPFQGRVMMMFLLRWAHQNQFLIDVADYLARVVPWLRPQGSPEFIVQFVVDTASILFTGFVATSIYRAASRERLLTAGIYPLVLVGCIPTYLLHVTQFLRFYYDFPSLAFFSAGIYLIYFRRSPAVFALLFMVGTMNRETTLFLLLFYLLANAQTNGRLDWRLGTRPRVWGVLLPLGLFWATWHVWIGWTFRHNPSAFSWRCALNAVTLFWPPAWPQLLSLGGYLLPVIFMFRKSIADPTLRVWLWTIPAWLAVMFFYGMWIESRILGELIPYLACLTALIAEQAIIDRLQSRPPQPGGPSPVPAIG